MSSDEPFINFKKDSENGNHKNINASPLL
jgi:hypothetical protein